jgi:putative oxidoreductase
MKGIMQWLIKPPVDGPRSVLLLRLMVGGVFFWEGVLKFVHVNQGVGRFTKLGMPFPAFTADFVAAFKRMSGERAAAIYDRRQNKKKIFVMDQWFLIPK